MPRLTPKQKTEKLNKILDYIRLNYRRYKKYPALEFIEKRFHTNLRTYNLNIKKVYRLANVLYRRDPNPFLRYKKEKLLAEIAKKLFPKLGYKIKSTSIGPSKPNGADIKAPYGYLITSTDKKTLKTVPSNIKILFAKDLKQMLT